MGAGTQGKGAMGSKSEVRHFLFLRAEIVCIGVFGVAEHESGFGFDRRGTLRAPRGASSKGKGSVGSKSELHFAVLKG